VDQVERQTGPIKRDCFGFADFVGVSRGSIYWIQATSKSEASRRRKKVQENKAALLLAQEGHLICVYGWKDLSGDIYEFEESVLMDQEWIIRKEIVGLEDLQDDPATSGDHRVIQGRTLITKEA
jgi:hypothetical protein